MFMFISMAGIVLNGFLSCDSEESSSYTFALVQGGRMFSLILKKCNVSMSDLRFTWRGVQHLVLIVSLPSLLDWYLAE